MTKSNNGKREKSNSLQKIGQIDVQIQDIDVEMSQFHCVFTQFSLKVNTFQTEVRH